MNWIVAGAIVAGILLLMALSYEQGRRDRDG